MDSGKSSVKRLYLTDFKAIFKMMICIQVTPLPCYSFTLLLFTSSIIFIRKSFKDMM